MSHVSLTLGTIVYLLESISCKVSMNAEWYTEFEGTFTSTAQSMAITTKNPNRCLRGRLQRHNYCMHYNDEEHDNYIDTLYLHIHFYKHFLQIHIYLQ